MKFSIKNFGLGFVALAALSTSSCKKETVAPMAPALSNQQYEDSRNYYFTTYDYVLQAIGSGNLSFKNESAALINGCAVVTLDTVANPHTVLIDFGDACTGNDGKVYGGQVYATFNNTDLGLTGSYVDITTYDFTIDGDAINGGLRLVNNGPGPNARMEGTLEVTANITYEGHAGDLHGTFNYDLWWEDLDTPQPGDDSFLFFGTGAGYTTGGRAFTQEISRPLVRRRSGGCNFFVLGTVDLEVAGESTRTLDYGEGDCDDIATITQDGVTQTITLQ